MTNMRTNTETSGLRNEETLRQMQGGYSTTAVERAMGKKVCDDHHQCERNVDDREGGKKGRPLKKHNKRNLVQFQGHIAMTFTDAL